MTFPRVAKQVGQKKGEPPFRELALSLPACAWLYHSRRADERHEAAGFRAHRNLLFQNRC